MLPGDRTSPAAHAAIAASQRRAADAPAALLQMHGVPPGTEFVGPPQAPGATFEPVERESVRGRIETMLAKAIVAKNKKQARVLVDLLQAESQFQREGGQFKTQQDYVDTHRWERPAVDAFANAATLNAGPAIAEGVANLAGQDVSQARKRFEASLQSYRREEPWKAGAAELAGGTVAGAAVGGGVGALAGRAGLGRTGQMVLAGAVPGALQGGFGAEEGHGLRGAIAGGTVGAVLGRVMPAIGQRLGRRLAPALHRLAGTTDEVAATAKQLQSIQEEGHTVLRAAVASEKPSPEVFSRLVRQGAPEGAWADTVAGSEARKAFQRGVVMAVEEGIEDGTISAADGSLERAQAAVRRVLAHSSVTGKPGNVDAEDVIRAISHAAKTHASTPPGEMAANAGRFTRALGGFARGLSTTDKMQGLVRGTGGALQQLATPTGAGAAPVVPPWLLPTPRALPIPSGASGAMQPILAPAWDAWRRQKAEDEAAARRATLEAARPSEKRARTAREAVERLRR